MHKSLIIFILGACLSACAGHDIKPSIAISQSRESPSPVSPSPSPSQTPHIRREEVALPSGLRIKRREMSLESNKRHYKVSVAYPEIEGPLNLRSRALNREIKRLVTKTYQWLLLPPTKDDLVRYSKWPGVFNSVDLEYDVIEANDRFLSIYFMGYHYGIGAAHSVHESFTLNYDLRTPQLLTLGSLFKSQAHALKLISQKCFEELSKSAPYLRDSPSFVRELRPTTKNFGSWNLTPRGLRVNFDACRVAGCADGDLQVEIPFEELREVSKSGGLLGNTADRQKQGS